MVADHVVHRPLGTGSKKKVESLELQQTREASEHQKRSFGGSFLGTSEHQNASRNADMKARVRGFRANENATEDWERGHLNCTLSLSSAHALKTQVRLHQKTKRLFARGNFKKA